MSVYRAEKGSGEAGIFEASNSKEVFVHVEVQKERLEIANDEGFFLEAFQARGTRLDAGNDTVFVRGDGNAGLGQFLNEFMSISFFVFNDRYLISSEVEMPESGLY